MQINQRQCLKSSGHTSKCVKSVCLVVNALYNLAARQSLNTMRVCIIVLFHFATELDSFKNVCIYFCVVVVQALVYKNIIFKNYQTYYLKKKEVRNMSYLIQLKGGVMLSESSYQVILINLLMKSCL